jgi:hypothetical protein
MNTRLRLVVVAVLLGALVSACLLSRVYVGQQIPPAEVERLMTHER